METFEKILDDVLDILSKSFTCYFIGFLCAIILSICYSVLIKLLGAGPISDAEIKVLTKPDWVFWFLLLESEAVYRVSPEFWDKIHNKRKDKGSWIIKLVPDIRMLVDFINRIDSLLF